LFLLFALTTYMAFALKTATHSKAIAHPGRTDMYGCHRCWTNCYRWGLEYGEYHCH
jgi:hypothetical protein